MRLVRLLALAAIAAVLIAWRRRPQDARARYPLDADDWATDPYTVAIWRTR